MKGFGALYAASNLPAGDTQAEWYYTEQDDDVTHITSAITISGTVAGVDILGKVVDADTPVIITSLSASGGQLVARYPMMSVRVRGATAGAGVRVSIDSELIEVTPASYVRP